MDHLEDKTVQIEAQIGLLRVKQANLKVQMGQLDGSSWPTLWCKWANLWLQWANLEVQMDWLKKVQIGRLEDPNGLTWRFKEANLNV